jgi:hypothetical protein
MSLMTDTAEAMSGAATFLTSTLGTGLIAFFVLRTKTCSGGFDGTSLSCVNVFGGPAFTTETAATFGTVTGFFLGALVFGIRELILDHARKRGEIA